MDSDVQFANVERGVSGDDSVGAWRGTNGSADHHLCRRNLVSHANESEPALRVALCRQIEISDNSPFAFLFSVNRRFVAF